MAHNGALSGKQKRFVAALAAAGSVREAAALAGIGERTAWRYLGLPDVRAELGRIQDGVLSEATAACIRGMSGALATLESVMADPMASASARVAAARAILDAAARLAELQTFAQRIAKLEEESGL